MEHFRDTYIGSTEAAEILGITCVAMGRLARQGKIPSVKVANRWLIPKDVVEEFAKTYEPRRGRPKTKRKYTRRRQA